jgi:hypothetical protein
VAIPYIFNWTSIMWPAIAIGFVCVFFMVFFQKNIRAFIDRTKGVKYRSAEVQTENPSQEPVDTTPNSAEKLMKTLDSPVLIQGENLIKEALDKAGVGEGTERENLLIRFLAVTNLALTFERIDSIIWGSQIYILEHLNTNRLGIARGDIKSLYYDEATKRWPTFFGTYSYDAYLGFLKNSNLILEQDGNLLITNFGVEFLQYLARVGKSGARFRPG